MLCPAYTLSRAKGADAGPVAAAEPRATTTRSRPRNREATKHARKLQDGSPPPHRNSHWGTPSRRPPAARRPLSRARPYAERPTVLAGLRHRFNDTPFANQRYAATSSFAVRMDHRARTRSRESPMPIVVAVVSVTRAGRARPIGHSRTCAGRRLPLVSKIARSPPGETRLGVGGAEGGHVCVRARERLQASVRNLKSFVARPRARTGSNPPDRARACRFPVRATREALASLAAAGQNALALARPAAGAARRPES